VMQVVTVSSGCEASEGIWKITGWGGGVFSPAFRRILSSSESPTRSQQPTWPSGMGVSTVGGAASATETGGGWIVANGVLLVECWGAFTPEDLGRELGVSSAARNPRRILAVG
jgi:hypothetical protein